MKIHFVIFVSSIIKKSTSKALMKTVESDFRPQVGDIIDDPGFDRKFHNGYEVVKVTVNYAEQECFASLAPLVVEQEEMEIEKYLNKLEENGWREMPNDKMN